MGRPCCWIRMTAPGSLPVATSLLKKSVMRSSLSGAGASAAWLAAPIQIATDKANAIGPTRDAAAEPKPLCANLVMTAVRQGSFDDQVRSLSEAALLNHSLSERACRGLFRLS